MKFRETTDTSWAALFDAQIKAGSRYFYRVAFDLLRNGGAAEEACQQAFLKAWERRASLKSPAAIKPWILSAIRKECLQVLRRRKTEELAFNSIASVTVEAAVENASSDIAQRESLLLAIDSLPELERKVVESHFFDQISGNQIAEELEISAGEVSKKLYRGLALLRIALSRNPPDWGE